MKKSMKKVLATGLSLVALFGATACGDSSGGGKSEPGENGYLKITAVELGYGTEWLKKMEPIFEQQSGINVDIVTKVGAVDAINTEIESKASDTDLFFNKRGYFAKDVFKGSISVKGQKYDCLYADLSDVWASIPEGETKTIEQKMDARYAEAYEIEGKYYALPWAGGVNGIVRNLNVWDQLELTEADTPYTTDQLFALCDKVNVIVAEKNLKVGQYAVAPFIYSTADEYYTGWSPIFFAQYEGVENANNFMEGKDPNGELSEYLYTYDGHIETLKVMEKLIKKENGYQHSRSEAMDFTSMQGQFLRGAGLFNINGSWLENEAKASQNNARMDMLKTPVISAIVKKLSFKNLDAAAADAKLTEIIKYVDAIDAGEAATKPSGVTDEDITKVTEARHYSYIAGGTDHQAYVPSYSAHVREAKEFLKFMYSDKGLNIYYEALEGAQLPATPTSGYTKELELSEFRVSVNNAQAEGFIFNAAPKSRCMVLGSIAPYFDNGVDMEVSLRTGKGAQYVLDQNCADIAKKWPSILELLGLF